jgi:hypothetical protein
LNTKHLKQEYQFVCCRFNLFEGCANAKTCTFILRGGAEQYLEETERSLHDAIMIVRRTMKNDAVVAGNAQIVPKKKKLIVFFLQVVVLSRWRSAKCCVMSPGQLLARNSF